MSLHPIEGAIAAQAIGRDAEAHLLALAIISREHALMVGAPGTAKSYLCRQLARAISDARYCERLLSETTPPEEIFGPWSLSALRADRYEHVTAGYAADAHVLFLDEVGRAGPAILNGLLHLLGPERCALLGTQQIAAPLVCAIGAANSWPEDAAMMDRWLLRATVNPLSTTDRASLLTWAAPALSPVTDLAGLSAMQAAAQALPWTPGALDCMRAILDALAAEQIAVSDRRVRLSANVARASAYLAGHADVTVRDLADLRYVLWTSPDDAVKAAEIILKLADPVAQRLDGILAELADIALPDGAGSGEQIAAIGKLDALLVEADKLLADGNGRAQKVRTYVQQRRTEIVAKSLGIAPELAAQLAGGAR